MMFDNRISIVMTPKASSVRAKLAKIRKEVGNVLPFHKQAATLLDRWVQKNFRSEGGELSDGKWLPFALGGRPVKKAKSNAVSMDRSWQTLDKQRRGLIYIDSTAKLLQDTGDLRKSHAPFYNKKTAGVGSDLPYAKHHHLGQGVPKRRTLPDDGEITNEVMKLLNLHLERAVKSASSK